MASERQIEANKANALKSTGPTSAQGKAVARRNAIKHGMTCEREHLFNRDAQLFKSRLESWTKTAKPQNDMELYQLESAVRATANLDRCARNAQAAMDKRTRRVVGHWDGEQTKKLTRVTEFWTTDPATCIAQLETFARGVEWLLERWEELSKALEANACWTGDEARQAMRLLGKLPEMFYDGDELVAFRTLVVAALPDPDPEELDEILGIDTGSLEPEARQAQIAARLPSREDAREGLWATLNAELERLEPIREKLWERQDGPAVTTQIDLVAFDGSKKGVLRRRYESANHLDMHRCLKQLTEQRRQSELRAEEEREIEEKAKAERRAETAKQVEKVMRDQARLRNEAKLSATTERRVSTSGKSASIRPRDFADPAEYIQQVIGAKQAPTENAPPPNPAAPGVDAAQKPA